MTATKIYFSHSFRDSDQRVVNAIRGVFNELRSRYHLEDVSTRPPTSEQLFSRLVGPMADVDIVVCIFTRRHRVATADGTATYTAPPYIVAEGAAAYTLKKRVLVFVENGLAREELGFVDAFNPQHHTFDAERCGQPDYHAELRVGIEEALKPLINQKLPPYTFTMYDAHITLYPNGYILANNRLDVRVLKKDFITHRFGLYPEENETVALPSASELYKLGREQLSPFPTLAFTAFASWTKQARLIPVDRDEADAVREYHVDLGGTGDHHYEWMYGTPKGFDPRRERDWYHFLASKRSIERIRIVLRLHRNLIRDREPSFAHIMSDQLDHGDPRDEQLAMMEREAEPLGGRRENPLFRCYELTLNEIGRGLDLVVLY